MTYSKTPKTWPAVRTPTSVARTPFGSEPSHHFRRAGRVLVHASISTTLSIYTHVVDASHRKAVEEVEERLFCDVDCCGLKLADGLENTPLASDSVN